jgi:hypothetical protein
LLQRLLPVAQQALKALQVMIEGEAKNERLTAQIAEDFR